MRYVKGTIAETGEKAIFVANGYWIAYGGRKITSYVRVDKEDNKQYSKDRHNNFYVETVD